MKGYTKEDVLRLLEEEDVEFIRLQFTDLHGTLKNIAVTAGRIASILENGCHFDASAADGFPRAIDSLFPTFQLLRSSLGDLSRVRWQDSFAMFICRKELLLTFARGRYLKRISKRRKAWDIR